MKIYICCPYSDYYYAIRQGRFVCVSEYAALLLSQGNMVFSPVTHMHPICNAIFMDHGFEHGEEFMKWADEVHVYQLDGWKESKGVKSEIEMAKKLGKEVKYIPYKYPFPERF